MDLYEDREQTQAKHDFLERYLEGLAFKTIGFSRSFDFIDAMAGPWKSRDPELRDTSIDISLRKLQAVAERHKLASGQVCCIFNERDREAYEQLVAFEKIARLKYPLVQMITFLGRFEDNAEDIKKASQSAFRLLYVDPTGFTGFPTPTLRLFAGRPTEVIINFMESFIRRFLTRPRAERERWLCDLLGAERGRELADVDLTGELLRGYYMEMLRKILGYRYAASSPIHHPDKDDIHFQMILGTHHPDGLDVMREAEFHALSKHDQVRFKKKGEEKFYDDLFGPQEKLGPYLRDRLEHLAHLPNAMLTAVRTFPGLKYEEIRALLQEQRFIRDVEVAKAASQLAEQGLIEPTWKERGVKKRRPQKHDRMRPA